MKGKKILALELLFKSKFSDLKSLFQAANELAKANGTPEYRPVWTCTGQGTFSNPYSVI